MPALKVKDSTGTWLTVPTTGPPGTPGATGATGPQGVMGIATTIIGEFTTREGADLPVDGAIPADWDGVGTFPGGYQMVVGQALINNNAASTTFGDLWQFVGTSDPAGWINVGQIVGSDGPAGPPGPTGPIGPDGLPGPTGPPLPVAGLVNEALVKVDGTDQNVRWGGALDINNAYLSMVGDGYGVIFHGGARLYKKSGAGLVLRKHAANTQIQIENNDGSGGRNIATVGSANTNVVYESGWSGAMQFRVNDLVVSCHMYVLAHTPTTGTATAIKICNYPSGVPAPWAQISVLGLIADNTAIASSNGTVEVQYRTDGVYLKTFSVPMNDTNHRLYGGSATWAR